MGVTFAICCRNNIPYVVHAGTRGKGDDVGREPQAPLRSPQFPEVRSKKPYLPDEYAGYSGSRTEFLYHYSDETCRQSTST